MVKTFSGQDSESTCIGNYGPCDWDTVLGSRSRRRLYVEQRHIHESSGLPLEESTESSCHQTIDYRLRQTTRIDLGWIPSRDFKEGWRNVGVLQQPFRLRTTTIFPGHRTMAEVRMPVS